MSHSATFASMQNSKSRVVEAVFLLKKKENWNTETGNCVIITENSMHLFFVWNSVPFMTTYYLHSKQNNWNFIRKTVYNPTNPYHLQTDLKICI